ncbi:MAG: phosphatidate cytidylyltransferase, partial [Dongiaceae bacterium]
MIASHLAPNLVWALAGVFAVLIMASLLVFGLGRRVPRLGTPELAARLRSWWIMILLFSGAILLSRTAALCFLGVVSFLALKEYLSLIPTRRVDRQVLLWVYLAVPVQYYWVATGWYGLFVIFVPVYMFLLLPVPMLLRGETKGFLKALGTLNWGLMATVFSLSHAAYLLVLPDAGNPVGGGAGLLLYLLILTEA